MPLNTLTSISVDGKTFFHFRELTIDQRIDGHHTFELYINQEWLVVQSDDIPGSGKDLLGKEICIHIAPADTLPHLKALHFKGLITAIHTGKEGDTSQGFCVLKGTDPGIVLDGEPQLQVYEVQTLADIARHCLKPLAPYSHSLIAPGNTTSHPYLVQYKESNFIFLQRLAARFGEWFFYNGQQMVFGSYAPAKITLQHPAELVNFDIRLQLVSNNRCFISYDYHQGSSISHDVPAARNAGTHPLTSITQQASRQIYQQGGTEKRTCVITDLLTQARLHERRQQSTSVQLTGCSENPGIRIGDIIQAAESIPTQDLEGTFTVTHLIHHCQGDGAYYNQFTSTPSDSCIPSGYNGIPPYCEAQSAIVTDNHDPEGMGRIRIRHHWQQQGSSPWIRLITPHSGAGKGFYFIPEKGEEVWVDFEGGDPELPFATGTVYNGKANTKFSDPDNNIKIIKTRSGHTIQMDDSQGAEQLQIHDHNGNIIQLDTHHGNITITSPGHLHLKARQISIEASEQLDLHAGENITQGAGENFSLYAGNHTTILSTHIIQQAQESFTRTSRRLEEQAESILLNSIKEDLTLVSSGTIAINSVEKIKLS
ncbi:type VI secretion system Vgr family protein [Chitinophaga flava]|uniref:Gp5/Type VI secretion system Vgr protein OB-fold domain-containing protein n=1 Tax=Chitinophaga flava TaxID=2259036 RepID=A0A365Y2B8_9BACT|nr:phage baseplate assembly protein V [Chitinophaga flava]RBL92749.1 hypothetical protein DF182_09275 [Chitinophaga flava]